MINSEQRRLLQRRLLISFIAVNLYWTLGFTLTHNGRFGAAPLRAAPLRQWFSDAFEWSGEEVKIRSARLDEQTSRRGSTASDDG